MTHSELILILDFGAQYTQLIARKVRECGVYAEILPYNTPLEEIKRRAPRGIILSGGPKSVYADDAPHPDKNIFSAGVPILGICYGIQLIAYFLEGTVDGQAHKEFGRAQVTIDATEDIFKGISSPMEVWMSHGDALEKLPPGFEKIAHTSNAPICAIRNREKKIFGVQFHPEVHHTPQGKELLKNFLYTVCDCKGGWTAQSFIETKIKEIRGTVAGDRVICALSGGVDSTVAAVLLYKAIGKQLVPIHIDNGVMRKGESEAVVKTFREHYNIDLDFVDASELFLSRLKGVEDPEKKRKIIGNTFIEVFEGEAKKFPDAKFLAQGTLYPDVIESLSVKGPSATIKTHHNVGGLPENMQFKLIEPFRELFKDEVRAVGRELEVPAILLERHPFPGPGLAIRVLGEVSRERLEILRNADEIFLDELRKKNLYNEVWQAFAVLLPVRSVGVMGDERTYDYTIALRAVTSVDGMTADWAHLPHEALSAMSSRISNEVRGVNRVVYDISSKPPATIEWE